MLGIEPQNKQLPLKGNMSAFHGKGIDKAFELNDTHYCVIIITNKEML
jgi:hypothetical protein